MPGAANRLALLVVKFGDAAVLSQGIRAMPAPEIVQMQMVDTA